MSQNQEKLVAEIAALSAELSHHVNNPLAVVMASLPTLERITRELSAAHASPEENAELNEVLSDVKLGLLRISRVVQKLTQLSFRISRPENLLGSPFDQEG